MRLKSIAPRLRKFLIYFVRQIKPKCAICNKKLPEDIFYKNCKDLVEHHIDENRRNEKPSNKCLVHKGCHQWLHKNKFSLIPLPGRSLLKRRPKLCPRCSHRIVAKRKDKLCRPCLKKLRKEKEKKLK